MASPRSMVRGNYPKIALLFQVSIILIYPDMSRKEKACLWDTGHFFSQRTLEFHVLNPWTSASNKGASSQMGKAMLHPSSLQWPIRDPNILSFWQCPKMVGKSLNIGGKSPLNPQCCYIMLYNYTRHVALLSFFCVISWHWPGHKGQRPGGCLRSDSHPEALLWQLAGTSC